MLCRLNLKHAWRLASSEDGESRFYRCERCGKERFPTGSAPDIIGGGWAVSGSAGCRGREWRAAHASSSAARGGTIAA